MIIMFESRYSIRSILIISWPIECPVWCGGYCMNDSRSLICRQVTIERRRMDRQGRVQWQKGPAYLEYSPYIRHVALVPYHSTLPPLLSVPRIQLYILVNTSQTIHISRATDGTVIRFNGSSSHSLEKNSRELPRRTWHINYTIKMAEAGGSSIVSHLLTGGYQPWLSPTILLNQY